MRYHPNLPNGFPKKKLREWRKNKNMQGKVQIHHIVPKVFSAHPVLLHYKYDVEEDYNFILMPTKEGKKHIYLRQSRPIHDGGHIGYNNFVATELNNCSSNADLLLLISIIYKGSKGFCRIPWSK